MFVMSRIHPTQSKNTAAGTTGTAHPSALTVWKKSSMAFQGTDGFSVYDRDGRLVFRVDNYSRKCRGFTGGLLLMDGFGRALLTLKPQIISLHDQWNGFEGDRASKTSPKTPLFSMRRRSIIQTCDEVDVFMGGSDSPSPDFQIDGCFRRRNCKIIGGAGEVVAEISRKKVNKTVLLGEDVFKLVVQPGFDCDLIMAFIVVMDRICRKPFSPLLCS